MRDNQKSKAYRAEDAALSGLEKPWDIHDVRAWVEGIVKSAWWRNRFICEEVDVRDGRGRRRACGYKLGRRGVIKLPRWSRQPYIVLHELAHVVSDDSHGPQWARTYLTLVDHCLGKDAAKTLRLSFQIHGVKTARGVQ